DTDIAHHYYISLILQISHNSITPPIQIHLFFFYCSGDPRDLHSFPTRRSSDLDEPAGISKIPRSRKHGCKSFGRSRFAVGCALVRITWTCVRRRRFLSVSAGNLRSRQQLPVAGERGYG